MVDENGLVVYNELKRLVKKQNNITIDNIMKKSQMCIDKMSINHISQLKKLLEYFIHHIDQTQYVYSHLYNKNVFQICCLYLEQLTNKYCDWMYFKSLKGVGGVLIN